MRHWSNGVSRCCGAADEHAGARADAIEDLAGHVVLDRHAEGFDEQVVIERARRGDVADGELNVRDAVWADHGRSVMARSRLQA